MREFGKLDVNLQDYFELFFTMEEMDNLAASLGLF